MATQRKRTPPKVDKATATAMSVEAKEKAMNDALDAPIPEGDGLDHARWPAEARKLAILKCDPRFIGATQEDLASACGYSLRSVNRYLTDADFKAYMNALLDKAMDDELYQIYVVGLKKGMLSGNSKFFEMYGKDRGRFKEIRQNVNENHNHDVAPASGHALDDELERLERETGVRKTVN